MGRIFSILSRNQKTNINTRIQISMDNNDNFVFPGKSRTNLTCSMKKIVRYCSTLFLFITIVLSGGCKDSGSPESITELFLISLNKLDYTTMRNISTRDTRELIKIMEALSKDKISPGDIEKRAESLKIKIKGKKVENDSTVYVEFVTEPRMLPIDQVQLVRVTEKLDKTAWKVNISTMDLMESGQQDQDNMLKARESYDGQIHPEADSVAAPE